MFAGSLSAARARGSPGPSRRSSRPGPCFLSYASASPSKPSGSFTTLQSWRPPRESALSSISSDGAGRRARTHGGDDPSGHPVARIGSPSGHTGWSGRATRRGRLSRALRVRVAFAAASRRRETDVEDGVQDVFVVVHTKLASFEHRSQMTTWIYGICINVAQARRRRAHVRRELPTDPQAMPLDETQHAHIDEAYERREAEALLDGILDMLPIEQRAVFTLFELDGRTCEEIAQLCAIPSGPCIRGSVSRARRSSGRPRGSKRANASQEVEREGTATTLGGQRHLGALAIAARSGARAARARRRARACLGRGRRRDRGWRGDERGCRCRSRCRRGCRRRCGCRRERSGRGADTHQGEAARCGRTDCDGSKRGRPDGEAGGAGRDGGVRRRRSRALGPGRTCAGNEWCAPGTGTGTRCGT